MSKNNFHRHCGRFFPSEEYTIATLRDMATPYLGTLPKGLKKKDLIEYIIHKCNEYDELNTPSSRKQRRRSNTPLMSAVRKEIKRTTKFNVDPKDLKQAVKRILGE